MRGSNATGKSERIKTHHCKFYTRIQNNMQCNSWVLSGSHNEPNILRALDSITTALSIHIKPGYRSWDTYQVCLETNLSFKSLLTLHKAAVPPYSMIRCLM
ncbi:hypothetical protein M9H77_17566 [Catharanthus roseus]|uniref:Uncharacterized protein n=1 Tax=Catharanthus roseus TaxID=4058 RepID=A0ACC0B4Y9_CATRO|nr:hypothetical protein M9H77_17566 [Catharanthus roseus]